MEKKTKTTKPKKTVKKVEKLERVEIPNQIDYTKIFNKIFYSLIAITVVLVAIFVAILVKGNTITPSTGTEVEESLGEYDVSDFDTLTTTDALAEIKKGETEIVYIGRETCGYCVQFLPILQQAQDEYDYKTIYIDLEQMTSDDQTKLLELDNEEKYIEENFGYTPMVLVFKDGKFSTGWVGYAEYDTFAAFLKEDAGLKK